MVKEASLYSKICNAVKIIAKKIVATNPYIASFLKPVVIAWWAQVIVAPDVNKIIVFNNGTSHGLKVWIPCGGQIDPISTEGAKLEWKKAQKKAKKNIISDIINNIIPYLNPFWTAFVWYPPKVASLITSLHQIIIVDITKNNPKNITNWPWWIEWKYITEPFIKVKAANDITKGQGLGVTKWYKVLISKFTPLLKYWAKYLLKYKLYILELILLEKFK